MNQLVILASGRGDGLPPDIDRHIAAEIDAQVGRLGLEPQERAARGATLVLEDGRTIADEWMTLEIPADLRSVRLATGALLAAIAHRHGKGRIWSPVQLVHIVRPYGAESDPVLDGRCRVRAFYFHEAAARGATPIPPPPDWTPRAFDPARDHVVTPADLAPGPDLRAP